MPSISQNLAALARRPIPSPTGPSRLSVFAFDGPNPGQLDAYAYTPAGLKPGAALVVVLHGCTQTAAGYDNGSGWSTLAEREGFALLFPEQQRGNNPNLCFNWFQTTDATRGAGEAASIHAMIRAMIEQHGLDPARVFITGLSAGGAMAATMLATYPETFAAGAIIAGIAHGAARTVPQAFSAMRGKGLPDAATLQNRLERASPHRGPWPRISIWQGSADVTVVPANAESLFAQWSAALGITSAPMKKEKIAGAQYSGWTDSDGRVVMERWTIPGMGHGTPIGPRADGLGTPAPYMLDVGLSSTARIASFFGLTDAAGRQKPAPGAVPARVIEIAPAPAPARLEAVAAAAGEKQPSVEIVVAKPVPESAPARQIPAEPGQDVAAYVNAVLDQHLPGKTGLFASVKTIVADALRKAGLK